MCYILQAAVSYQIAKISRVLADAGNHVADGQVLRSQLRNGANYLIEPLAARQPPTENTNFSSLVMPRLSRRPDTSSPGRKIGNVDPG
jgi:hypothetical protein